MRIKSKFELKPFYRSTAFMMVLIPVLLLVLNSCSNSPTSVKFYSTLSDCVKDGISKPVCEKAYQNARLDDFQNSRKYNSRTECINSVNEPCRSVSNGGSISYIPIMTGFAVDESGSSSVRSYPVYGQRSGLRLSGGESIHVSRGSRASVGVTRGFGSSFKSSAGRGSGG